MLSTITDTNYKTSANALFKQMWKGVQSIGIHNNIPDSMSKRKPSTVVSVEKRKRYTSGGSKNGRQFFEHDTRNNTDCFSYANTTSALTAISNVSKPILEINDHNSIGGVIDTEEMHPKMVSVHRSCAQPPSRSYTNEKPSFHCEAADSRQTQSINTKLRKKLFKTQRKLRLQAAALRKQQQTRGCCCNCACGGSAGIEPILQMYQNRQNKLQLIRTKNLNHNNISNCSNSGLSVCGAINNKFKKSMKGYGLRSVVR